MDKLHLFTDASVNTQTKTGFGSYLLTADINVPAELLKEQIKVKCFENTSSTKLELQTLLWAMNEIEKKGINLTIYTDSQNIISLLKRRPLLEQNNYMTGKNKLHANHLFYKEFFLVIDLFKYEFIKVKGHQSSSLKNKIEKIFTLVDKASRNALRRTKA